MITDLLPAPRFLGRGLNRLYYQKILPREYNHRGTAIIEEDWDNLLILDGCRYDIFRRYAVNTLTGELDKRQSRGSNTVEFLQANFKGKTLHDTVYVTANPQLYRHREEIDVSFFATKDIWRKEGWDEEHSTVLPETVTQFAKEAETENPNKRLIIHYMQPHYPFIGANFDSGRLDEKSLKDDHVMFWHRFMLNQTSLSRREVIDAYLGNLKRVIPAVRDLQKSLQGKTVVTADHGNMLGEPSSPVPTVEWGHPPGIYTEELVQVPWLISENGGRKQIKSSTPKKEPGQNPEIYGVLDKRLRQLGYRQ